MDDLGAEPANAAHDPLPQVRKAAEAIGVGGFRRHVFLCVGPACCTPEEGAVAWETLKKTLKEHQLAGGPRACNRTKAGCLRVCTNGPVMLVYPEGTWYHGMTAEQIPDFVREHLINGRPVEGRVFATNPLESAGAQTDSDRA